MSETAAVCTEYWLVVGVMPTCHLLELKVMRTTKVSVTQRTLLLTIQL